MLIQKSSGSTWFDKKTLQDGDILKLATEATDIEGQNGMQLVAKAIIKGRDDKPKNIAINNPSRNALIDAFGQDTADWVDKHLTIKVKETLVGGKPGIALYLIPEGFKLDVDENGFQVIAKEI